MDTNQAKRQIGAALAAALHGGGYRSLPGGAWIPVSDQFEGIVLWHWTLPAPHTHVGVEPLLVLRHVGLDLSWAEATGVKPSRTGLGLRVMLWELTPGRTHSTGVWWFPKADPTEWPTLVSELADVITGQATPFFREHATVERMLAFAQDEPQSFTQHALPLLLWFAGRQGEAIELAQLGVDRWCARVEGADAAIAPIHVARYRGLLTWMQTHKQDIP